MKVILTFIMFLMFISVIGSSDMDSKVGTSYAAFYGWMDYEMFEGIEKYSRKYKFRPPLIAALINRESDGSRTAVSSSGAVGSMQLMPCHSPGDPDKRYDLDFNLDKGCAYLKQCWDASNYELEEALRMYNQGINGDRDNYNNWGYVEDIIYDYTSFYMED